MNSLTKAFIIAIRDRADEFRKNEFIEELPIGRLPSRDGYFAKLHIPLNGIVKNDDERHKVFSVIFARNIGTAKMVTNVEVQALTEVISGFKIRHANFKDVVEDIINENS